MNSFEKEVIERLTKIEEGLNYHIKRTDDLQALTSKMENRYWLVLAGVILAVTGFKLF